MALIKFKTQKDKVDGYYFLSLQGTVRSLDNGFFEVNDSMLDRLRKENIDFEVMNGNFLDEAGKIRNTPSIVIQ